MARYTAWKTVIDDVEKKHRSENKTFEWLREQAANLADGTKVSVFVQELQAGDRWYTFDTYIVRNGVLDDV